MCDTTAGHGQQDDALVCPTEEQRLVVAEVHLSESDAEVQLSVSAHLCYLHQGQ